MVRSGVVVRGLVRSLLLVVATGLLALPASAAAAQTSAEPPAPSTSPDVPPPSTTDVPLPTTTDVPLPTTTDVPPPTTPPLPPPVEIGPALVTVSCALGATAVDASWVDVEGVAGGPTTLALDDLVAGSGATVTGGVVVTAVAGLQAVEVTALSTSGAAATLGCTAPARATGSAPSPSAPPAIAPPPSGSPTTTPPELAYTGPTTDGVAVAGLGCVALGALLVGLGRRGRST